MDPVLLGALFQPHVQYHDGEHTPASPAGHQLQTHRSQLCVSGQLCYGCSHPIMCYVLWMITSHNATSLEASAEPMFAPSLEPEGLLFKNNVTNSSLSIWKGFLNSTSQIFNDPSDMLFHFHNSIF